MQHWTLDVRGLGLRVWDLTGAGHEGVPTICLHGFLDQGLTFGPLAAGRPGRWLAPDQRGFGGSDWAAPASWYHFPDHVADLDALVEHLCPTPADQVNLVGHSMGGTVCLLYAAARPDRVRRLAVLDGLGPLHPPGDEMVPRLQRYLAGMRTAPTQRTMPSVDDAAARLSRRNPALHPDQAAALAEHGTRPADDGTVTWSYDPRHRIRSPHTLYEPLLKPFLEAVRAPTLVVWADDGFYPPAIRQSRVALLRDVATTNIAAGHMLHVDAPRAVGDRVEAFLAPVFS